MNSTWKSFSELCLYMSVISTFPRVFASNVSLWLILICCCGAVLLMEALAEAGHHSWRYIALLPAIAPCIFIRQPLDAVIILPAVVYAGFIIIRGNRGAEYYSYRSLFVKLAIGWVIYAGFMLLGAYMSARGFETTGETVRIKAPGMMIYGCLFLLTGTLLLRQLRINIIPNRRTRTRANAIYISVLLGSAAVLATLSDGIKLLLGVLSHAILTAGAYTMFLPMKVIDALKTSAEYLENRDRMIDEAADYDTAAVAAEGTWAEMVSGIVEEQEKEETFPWFMLILVVVVLCVLLVILLRKSVTLPIHENNISEVPIEPAPREKKADKRSSRERVRRAYRVYLKNLSNVGILINRSDLSEDILYKTERGNENKAARKLRRVYCRARYDVEQPVTEDMVSEAEKAVKDIY